MDMFAPEEDSYDYNDAVTYSCIGDYTLIGSQTISCIENGTFHPSPPRCLLIKCDAPIIDNAVRIEGKSPPYSYNNILRYKLCLDKMAPTTATNSNNGTPTPPTNHHGRNIGIGVGVVCAILAVGGFALCFLKKRTGFGKVPTRHGENA
ncbi:hypothetical protein AMELA_G00201190 [Ameiurus melas]|uniref:Sushi domain-containing protein n=1 Tax=Ameiurus melas TaxID=219545 RepID=A0A7J6A9C3_AMEME|nr:hypothetical protein AMELA_G00201190 [Ameiurus melas]